MTEDADGEGVKREKGEQDAPEEKTDNEVEETEEGYRQGDEERWINSGWWSDWNQEQPQKTWTEEEGKNTDGTVRPGTNTWRIGKMVGQQGRQ